ncbi:hypothetical protein Tco_1158320 [Tanacetum coccineum]
MFWADIYCQGGRNATWHVWENELGLDYGSGSFANAERRLVWRTSEPISFKGHPTGKLIRCTMKRGIHSFTCKNKDFGTKEHNQVFHSCIPSLYFLLSHLSLFLACHRFLSCRLLLADSCLTTLACHLLLLRPLLAALSMLTTLACRLLLYRNYEVFSACLALESKLILIIALDLSNSCIPSLYFLLSHLSLFLACHRFLSCRLLLADSCLTTLACRLLLDRLFFVQSLAFTTPSWPSHCLTTYCLPSLCMYKKQKFLLLALLRIKIDSDFLLLSLIRRSKFLLVTGQLANKAQILAYEPKIRLAKISKGSGYLAMNHKGFGFILL